MSGAQTATDGSDSAFTEVPELKEGFRLLYVQQYPEAREKFSVWTAEHPADPFGFVAEAASYLFEEFYRQGVMTSEFFMDDRSSCEESRQTDPERMKNFGAELSKPAS
jgi:hypothetical protein